MTAVPALDVTIVTGMSGAGRSSAGDVLEDLGFFVIDNLPPALIPKITELARGGERPDRYGLVVDVRSGAFMEDLDAALGAVGADDPGLEPDPDTLWALIFTYMWAGPHHLHYTALPDWAQSIGMLFSLILLAPSWGGMINGIMTLSGAWYKLRDDPILKFMIVSLSSPKDRCASARTTATRASFFMARILPWGADKTV